MAAKDDEQAKEQVQDSDQKPETDSQGNQLTNEEIREKHIQYSDDESIIFDMDQIKSRSNALDTLADTLKEKVIR